MTREDIEAVMRKIPDLNAFGVGLGNQDRRLSPEERAAKMEAYKRELINSEEMFSRACEWLGRLKPIKTVNERHSSYGLKHLAEPEIGYITNGAFIAAVVHCGFPYKIYPDSPNVSFGISEKSIKAADPSRKSSS